VLHITDARKTFGRTVALDGCALDVGPREWVGLLGPNGAGKTTLIRAIAGRVALDAGTLTLFGTDVPRHGAAATEARRRLGIVPQELALYPMLTARENLEVFGSLHGVRGAALRDAVSWALDFTGLADRASDRVRTFSGGMKRRLNIACSVLHKPSLVLLDEPTVGVDPQSRQRIWEMLETLRADGAALLLTTHHLDEAQQLCDRIAIIDHGRIVASGTVRELIASTIGHQHEVTMRLESTGGTGVAGDTDGADEADTDVIHARITDVATELAPLLARTAADGRTIVDVHLTAPSLHAVFIALTGRELRE